MSSELAAPWPVPNHWKVTTMGEACEVVGGSTPKSKEPRFWGGDISWLGVSDLTGYQGQWIGGGARSITQEGYDSCGTALMPRGTVLFSSRAPIGYVAIADGPICTSQGFKSFVPPAGIVSEFLYWYLRALTPTARSSASGTTFPELSTRAAKQLPLVIPPLDEQRAIVVAIEDAFARIDAIEAELDAVDRLHIVLGQASARDAFARVDAEEITLGQLCERQGGAIQTGPFGSQLHAADYQESGTPVLMPRDLDYGQVNWKQAARVGSDHVERLGRHVLRPGDIVQSRRGDLRRRALITSSDERALCGTGCFVIRLNDESLAAYVMAALGEPTTAHAIDRESVGVTMPNLNGKILAGVRIRLPQSSERVETMRLAEREAHAADGVLAITTTAKGHLKQLRHALLHAAFRGELGRAELLNQGVA